VFLDAAPKGVGRVLLAVLAGTGLRIGEALALRWRDVDLGTGTLYGRDAKTPKGVREVHMTPALREVLAIWRADSSHTGQADYVVCTATGKKQNPSNLRRDVLTKAVEAANAKLEEAGIALHGRPVGPRGRTVHDALLRASGEAARPDGEGAAGSVRRGGRLGLNGRRSCQFRQRIGSKWAARPF
jgi:integrase